MPAAAKQNPRVSSVEVGLRDLSNIRIYPLSIGHEIEVSDLISETVTNFMSQGISDIDKSVVDFTLNTLIKNLKKILELVTDNQDLRNEGYGSIDELMKDMDNDQLADIAEVIYKNNFARIAKKLKSSLKTILPAILKMVPETDLREPSPESLTSTQDTDLSTFTEESSPKEG